YVAGAPGPRPLGVLVVPSDKPRLGGSRAGVSKFMVRERLKPLLARFKRQGRTVVFANGCFDLLHVGHLRYLNGAKRAGGPRGVLVVALNTDAGVRRLKGPSRPLMPLRERLELISALSCVDYVTSFAEPSAGALLRSLRPDIQAKGSDYTPDSVPEAALMRSLGGRVVITGDPKNHSTTALMGKLRRAYGRT
ncbi:MAG: adenylyltransferase/cytidyltransferase family protein, partial [bacterium]